MAERRRRYLLLRRRIDHLLNCIETRHSPRVPAVKLNPNPPAETDLRAYCRIDSMPHAARRIQDICPIFSFSCQFNLFTFYLLSKYVFFTVTSKARQKRYSRRDLACCPSLRQFFKPSFHFRQFASAFPVPSLIQDQNQHRIRSSLCSALIKSVFHSRDTNSHYPRQAFIPF